jgi:hypothetical protein
MLYAINKDTRHYALTISYQITWMISSNPYHPLTYSGGITHTWMGGVMDGRWRSIGDGGDEDLLQIPVPAGCQNGVSGSESRFLMAAQRKSIWEKDCLPDIMSSEGICRWEGRPRGWLGPPHARVRRQGWAAPPVHESPSGLLSLLSSGFVGLLVK